jgi:hypothetical protein
MNIFLGICLIAVALCLRFIIRKRKFNRRNQFGLETFKSYEDSIATPMVDNVIGCAGAIILVLGIVLIVIGLK